MHWFLHKSSFWWAEVYSRLRQGRRRAVEFFNVILPYFADAPRTNHRVYGVRALPRPTTKKAYRLVCLFCGGQRWIRTTEVEDVRFTVWSIWPLWNLPIYEIIVLLWSRWLDSNPQPADYKSAALPLSYTGITPSNTYHPFGGALGRNRTTDRQIFSLLLYQLSYQGACGDPERARTVDLQRDRLAL